ncbi:SURF1 family protein [Undibacterium jejuense]|uniref:SURF1-like protein n=1 Tax=Undibacterium jejuense TaxID=1344949 RepID=A0A923HEM2_9BURK|nr:SURF1 family protein [Undibacterium jejuense]MBC3863137.1 SURF1 family protein [Undibacterium jejuense]
MIDRLNHATTDADALVVNASQPRSKFVRVTLTICAGLLFLSFFLLGTWQIKRLQWKLDLIARVEQRVHAAPQDVPVAANWAKVNAAQDEYRHVRLSGTYLYQYTSLVLASTELGPGYWVMTPLRMDDNNIVWINRGYIPTAMAGQFQSTNTKTADAGVMIAGLLRISEPNGGFLRHNDPSAQRWFSRDIEAMSTSHRLTFAAPYFVDLEAHSSSSLPEANEYPVPGLTVIAFHNSHLVYALTWYVLALMVAGAYFYVWREDKRLNAQRSSRQVS